MPDTKKLKAFLSQITRKLGAKPSALLKAFTAALYADAHPEDLKAYDPAELAAVARDSLKFLSAHRPGRAAVRIVNPEQAGLAEVSIIEITNDDMPFLLGAQNCHDQDSGAFTGEVSPALLAKLDVTLVIVGHSERRELFGETDEFVNAKVRSVFRHGMTPIMCVGETLDERSTGQAESKVAGQVAGSLAGLSPDVVGGLVVAYEPIWAIGTGETGAGQKPGNSYSLLSDTEQGSGAWSVQNTTGRLRPPFCRSKT